MQKLQLIVRLATMEVAVDVVSIVNRMTGNVLQQCADMSIQALDTRLADDSHRWFRIPASDGHYIYKNVATGYVLDHQISRYVGRGLLATSALDHPNNQWRESPYDNAFVALENRKSGRFLDNCENNAVREIGANGNRPSRQWSLISHQPADNESHTIVSFTKHRSETVLVHDEDAKAIHAPTALSTNKQQRHATTSLSRRPLSTSRNIFFSRENVTLETLGQEEPKSKNEDIRSKVNTLFDSLTAMYYQLKEDKEQCSSLHERLVSFAVEIENIVPATLQTEGILLLYTLLDEYLDTVRGYVDGSNFVKRVKSADMFVEKLKLLNKDLDCLIYMIPVKQTLFVIDGRSELSTLGKREISPAPEVKKKTRDANTNVRLSDDQAVILKLKRDQQKIKDQDSETASGPLTPINRNTLDQPERILYKAKDNKGFTALLSAAYNGDLDAVQYLVECYVDIEAKDNEGFTALLSAASSGHLDVVKYLVEQGADKEAKTKTDSTALLIAFEESS